MSDKNVSIAIISIATNKYFEYWKDMVTSCLKIKQNNINLSFHVITNEYKKFNLFKDGISNAKMIMHEIENLEWPYATLLRYKLIMQIQNELDSDIVMYIDADMKFHSAFEFNEVITPSLRDVVLIKHPGFWRPKFQMRVRMAVRQPTQPIKDLVRFIKLGGLGDWELKKKSMAYVPRKYRREYVCGGFWLGERESILNMCKDLSYRVDSDLSNNIIPVWHDESYLNYWSAQNKYVSFNPEFSYEPNYQNLTGLEMKIEAVDKGSNFLRNETCLKDER